MNYLKDPYVVNNEHEINRNNCYLHEEEKKNINVQQKDFINVQQKDFINVEQKDFINVQQKDFINVEQNEFINVEQNEFINVEQKDFINVEESIPQNNDICSRKRYINYNNFSGPYNIHNNFYNHYKKQKKHYNANNFYPRNNIFCHNQQNGVYHMNINNINVSKNGCIMNKITKSFEKKKQKKSSSHGLYKHVNDTTTCLLDNQIYEPKNLYLNTDSFVDCEQNKNDSKKHRNNKHVRDCEYVYNSEFGQNSDEGVSSLSCEDKSIHNPVKRSFTLNDKNAGSGHFLNERIVENMNYHNNKYEDSKNHVSNKCINDTYCNNNNNNNNNNNIYVKNETCNNFVPNNHTERYEKNCAHVIEREEDIIKHITKYNEEGKRKKKRNMDILSKDEILKDAIEYFQKCSSRNIDKVNYDSSYEDEMKIKNLHLKENMCYVCKEKEHIYKCPYCETCTCSLVCSKNHKKIFKCTQKLKKNLKIKNVSKGNFDESILYKDFLYLQNIETIIRGNYKYIKVKNYETTNIWLLHNKILIKLLKKRKIILLKAPIFTKIHKENKTFIYNHILFWTIKITFVNLNIRILYHEINENLTFLQIIQYLCSKMDKLQTKIFIYLQNVKSIYVSLNNEQPNKRRKNLNHHQNKNENNNYNNNNNACDMKKYCSVQQVLRKSLWGKSFYEYPHFHIEILYEDNKPIVNPLYELEHKKEEENQQNCQQEGGIGNNIYMREGGDDNKEGDEDNKEDDEDNKEDDEDNDEGDEDNKEDD
ncbi:hypothetical protein PRSY57_0803900 [Plasmodium reichenowi]|uniref:HIT-type domain-containing protein n=1 Tax=Plasmodium reichenowi TaxID=5854 RepID=A0A151LJG6_PLARE|nr:hypothetical protein PRSY57_0803900 [Plasmodium reichenowi]KYN99145.1 hypothetical protein PRSY57_0803900 [Plasmodium reichenowi]